MANDKWKIKDLRSRNHEHTTPGLALWRANFVKATRLHFRCGSHPCTWHWRKHRDLQFGEQHSAAATAVSRTRSRGPFDPGKSEAGSRDVGCFASGLCCLPRAESLL